MFFFCIILIILLTGCGTQNYSLKVNDDNSVEYKIRITVDSTTYDLLSSYGVDMSNLNRNKKSYGDEDIDSLDAVFQEQAMLYRQYNYDIVNVTDTVEIGFEALKKYNTIDEFNSEIKEMYDRNLIGTNVEVIKEETSFGETYKVYGTLEYILDEDVDLEDPAVKENFDNVYNKSKLSATLSINVPGHTEITTTDGAQNDRLVTWEAFYEESGEPKEVHVISEYKSKGFYVLICVVGIVALVVIAIVGLKIYKRIIQKKEKARGR